MKTDIYDRAKYFKAPAEVSSGSAFSYFTYIDHTSFFDLAFAFRFAVIVRDSTTIAVTTFRTRTSTKWTGK